jgi:hypothetical protein
MNDSAISPFAPLTRRKNIAAVVALALSFLTIGGIGSALICSFADAAPGLASRAFYVAAAIYFTTMLAVHVVGYRLWKRQYLPTGNLRQPSKLFAITVLTASFILIGGAGSAGLYWALKDLPHCTPRIAFGRAAVFAAVMLFVHVVGYMIWSRQFAAARTDGRKAAFAIYRRPIRSTLLQQGVCLILAALVLDTGEFWHATMIAILSYWMSVSLIFARRWDAPTRGDLAFIRWAFFAIWFFAVIVGPMVWYRMVY